LEEEFLDSQRERKKGFKRWGEGYGRVRKEGKKNGRNVIPQSPVRGKRSAENGRDEGGGGTNSIHKKRGKRKKNTRWRQNIGWGIVRGRSK